MAKKKSITTSTVPKINPYRKSRYQTTTCGSIFLDTTIDMAGVTMSRNEETNTNTIGMRIRAKDL